MIFIKYIGIIVCSLLIVDRLPAVVLISRGLILGPVDDPIYFSLILLVNILVIVGFSFMIRMLFKSINK